MSQYTHVPLVLFAAVLSTASLCESAFYEPKGLYFREDTQDTPAAVPITQEHIANGKLELKLYGPGRFTVKKSYHESNRNDPHYIWSGLCEAPWAVAFYKRGPAADLSGPRAEIRIRTKNFKRRLYIILKTPDGWLISADGAGESKDWKASVLRLKNMSFFSVDVERIRRGKKVQNATLGEVTEIGFTDLQSGAGSEACSRIDWLEVWTESPTEKQMYIVEAVDGYQFYQGAAPVCFYHTKPNSYKGQYSRCNYVHPLTAPGGYAMTDDFPEDHLHHRGIFWAWHQVIVNGQRIHDMWSCENFVWDVHDVEVIESSTNSAALEAKAYWKSPQWEDGKEPFVREDVLIRAHAMRQGRRAVDFRIMLEPLAAGVEIGGADNDKGYGGFSARIPLPKDLKMTGSIGPVTPQRTAVEGGAWMNFTGTFTDEKSSFTIFSHPSNPGHRPKWILRNAGSCQNPVYPGHRPVPLSKDNPLVLRYRVLLHKDADLQELYRQYSSQR